MEMFDLLGKKAFKVCKVTANKSEKIAKEARLRFRKKDLSLQLKEIYEEIGAIVYKKYVDSEELLLDREIEENCIKAEILVEEVKNIYEELLKLKNKKRCNVCYKEMEEEYIYCPSCGEMQEDEEFENYKEDKKEGYEEFEEIDIIENDIIIEDLKKDEELENFEENEEVRRR